MIPDLNHLLDSDEVILTLRHLGVFRGNHNAIGALADRINDFISSFNLENSVRDQIFFHPLNFAV